MDIAALISCVFKRNALWNKNDFQHRNSVVSDRLWDAVAAEMNMRRDVLEKKWEYLRNTYRRELNKLRLKRPRKKTDYSSSWIYFKQLNFLKDQFADLYSETDHDTIDTESNTEEMDDNENNVDNSVNKQQAESAQTNTPVLKERKIKKRKYLTNIEENTLRILENQTKKEEEKKDKEKRNEDELFFDSLMPYVRPLRPQQKMLLKIKMQELIYKFVYENQDSQAITLI